MSNKRDNLIPAGIPIYPTHYTTHDGGDWLRWNFGAIEKLPVIVERDNRTTRIVTAQYGLKVRVHSLALDNPAKGVGNFPRWDCINGWTTPPKILYVTSDDIDNMLRKKGLDIEDIREPNWKRLYLVTCVALVSYITLLLYLESIGVFER